MNYYLRGVFKNKMNYEEKIEEIFSRHPSVQNVGFNGNSYKAGIEAMEEFDKVLGHPWQSYECIHVAGTNGKGSVSSMLAVALCARRYKLSTSDDVVALNNDASACQESRIGLYTSPHLMDFRERIKIISSRGGEHYEMISKEDVMEFFNLYDAYISKLSFFEITTGMALWWFRKKGVQASVIEVGLGGRLDSTNIIQSSLSIITSIGLDHCALLGNSRREIAFEKAGIIKTGSKALIWGRDEQTQKVFEEKAKSVGAECYWAEDFETYDSISTKESANISLDNAVFFNLDLKGEYQSLNIRTVLAALKILGLSPDLTTISKTAEISGLRGRWEVINECPLSICDIGHNAAALSYNFAQLEKLHLARNKSRLYIIYGIMRDKNLEEIVPLFPSDATYFLCSPKGERALDVDSLYRKIESIRPELKLKAFSSVKEAVNKARELATENDIIYIGGSNFVVAEALG